MSHADEGDPVIITPEIVLRTSRQVTAYLLCTGCEQRFSVHERAALALCFRGKNRFRLRDALAAIPPVWPGAEILAIPTAEEPDIDVTRLVYFAASVFWRSAAHTWRFGTTPTTIDLGPYERQLRTWLLDEQQPFPEHMVIWISIGVRDPPLLTACTPFLFNKTDYYQYRFNIPGLIFDLFAGGQVPTVARRMCTMRSPERFVYITRLADQGMLAAMTQLCGSARPARNVDGERLRYD
jgi:hypothetical protein